ncbi:hypothetical protein FUAX_54820 (plasmid) [Fulvitalea axinellae]|uniref:Por secretion system C-terminal sorting domain-containing protein n=1 Tax=Fulvitalea axinellae TaxID=1182444 RepID=A0AAU9DKJ4_9BACT|nr:hypothetical protein FUAX_54820 [Fulvitalea axinellae]
MRSFLFVLFFSWSFSLYAQEKLGYRHQGKNIEFTVSQEEVYVEFATSQKSTLRANSNSKMNFEKLSNNSGVLKISALNGSNVQSLRSKATTGTNRIEPVLIYKDGTRQIAKGELHIKLKNKGSLSKLLKGISFTYEPDQFDEHLYLVKLDLQTTQLFELIDKLEKNDQVEFAEPNFIRLIKPHTNDSYFPNQWSINNQGYLGGNVDADMDVDLAWRYKTGAGIKVAVIDEGVDLSHTDLTSNLLSGYDATGNGSNGAPNEANDDAHGTACAGIVAAVANNGEGVAGVAYNAKVIPVRIAYTNGYPLRDSRRAWVTSNSWIAQGINWAWQNGADVLSNSYGGGPYSSVINNAINNAVNNGRNGKGAIVLFSSGNSNNDVSFPAYADNAIAVGASSMCDKRKSPSSCDGENKWGSCYGSKLDVVAPGVKIYTTDISGSSGYRSEDHMSDFNGTSSACPNAAGAVALILSANPNLTHKEVRRILENTSDKVGSYSYKTTSGHPNGTWNNEMGYGRVNAVKAVEEAIKRELEITGPELICHTGGTYTLTGLPSTLNSSIVWTVSPTFQFVSGNGTTSCTVKIQNGTSNYGWVQANIHGIKFRKEIWIGKPSGFIEINPVICSRHSGQEYRLPESIEGCTYKFVSNSSNLRVTKYAKPGDLLRMAASEPGWYKLTVTSTNSCGTEEGIIIVTAEDCDNGGGGFEPFQVYPNPVTGQSIDININYPSSTKSTAQTARLSGPWNRQATVELLSEKGFKLREEKTSEEQISLPVLGLPEGTYYLRITVNGVTNTKRVVIQK